MVETILVVAGLVLVAGGVAAWPFLRRRPERAMSRASEPADPRQELEARYRALAELEEDLAAGKLSPEDHARLKLQPEREAAALLARVEGLEATPTKPTPRSKQKDRRPPATVSGRGGLLGRPAFLAGGGVLLLLLGVGLGLLIPWFIPVSPSPPRAGPVSDRLAQLERELRADPTDLKKLLAFGHLALDEGRQAQALWAYREVLNRDPNNVEAIAHTGLLIFLGGHVDQALSHLDRALALDPKYAHALWDKANILFRAKQDYSGAIKTLEAFLVLIPSGRDADQARAMIAEARARAGVGPTAPPAGKPGAALTRPLPPALLTAKAAQAYQVFLDAKYGKTS